MLQLAKLLGDDFSVCGLLCDLLLLLAQFAFCHAEFSAQSCVDATELVSRLRDSAG